MKQLEKMSKEELVELKTNVEKALHDREVNAFKDAQQAAEEAAKQFGFSLKQLAGAEDGRRRRKAPKAQFRHPENPELTWSGRGRQPHWFREQMEAGKTKDDLRI